MGFLLAVLSFVVAEEVVELEPVNAGTDKYKCSLITSSTDCNANPYCHYLAGNSPPCIDDPCFNGVQPSDLASCPIALGVTCAVQHVSAAVLASDCVGGTGTFCGSEVNSGDYDYCFWALLRDGKCPDSVCKKENNPTAPERCVPDNTQECAKLSTKEECGLVPKCVWRSTSTFTSAGECKQDPCFVGSENKSCGGAFLGGGWIEQSPAARQTWQKQLEGGDLVPADCVLFQPYTTGEPGSTSYCVYKENKNPNKCYFLKSNTSTTSGSYNTDYGATYPTNTGSGPNCNSVISACDAHVSGECLTKWNPRGALAGQYCGDKDHGSNGALSLHSSSLSILLAFVLLYLAL